MNDKPQYSVSSPGQELLTVEEFAEKARLNVETVYRRIKDIPHVRIGRTIRIPASILELKTNKEKFVKVIDCWPAARSEWYASMKGHVYKVVKELESMDLYIVEIHGDNGSMELGTINKSHCRLLS